MAFYGLNYCLIERGYIVSYVIVINHRRVARITEREIPNSSEAMSVTNLGFVWEGVRVIVVAWTHLKVSGVGEVWDKGL